MLVRKLRVFSIVLVILILVLSFSVSANAPEYIVLPPLPETTYVYYDYFIVSSNGGGYLLYFFKNPTKQLRYCTSYVGPQSNSVFQIEYGLNGEYDTIWPVYIVLQNGVWSDVYGGMISLFDDSQILKEEILYSTADIYDGAFGDTILIHGSKNWNKQKEIRAYQDFTQYVQGSEGEDYAPKDPVETEEPESPGGIIGSIFQAIDALFDYFFIPKYSMHNEINALFDEKFAFVDQIKDLATVSIFESSGEEPPPVNITLYGVTTKIIDFSMFEDYRGFIHGLIIAFAYAAFIPKLVKRLPSVIGGI